MSGKFSINLTLQNGKALVLLNGVMDEDMDLGQLGSVQESEVHFDFNGVTGINSCGIRDWIASLEGFGGQKVSYLNCPQVIIEQMNMVKGFLPDGASIVSFYAPFFCENCENEEKVLLTPDKVQGNAAPKDVKCSACGAEGMEFDALESQYFHFLK